MKKIIRQGMFETNSSSTHSLIWMKESEYYDWIDGKLYLDYKTLITPDKYNEIVQRNAKNYNLTVEEILNERREYELPVTYQQYLDDNEYLDMDDYHYKTEHGDEIVALCTYGRDG